MEAWGLCLAGARTLLMEEQLVTQDAGGLDVGGLP